MGAEVSNGIMAADPQAAAGDVVVEVAVQLLVAAVEVGREADQQQFGVQRQQPEVPFQRGQSQ